MMQILFGMRTSFTALTIAALTAIAGPYAQPSQDDQARRLVDDYIRLYRGDTLQRWKLLFLPGFTASYTNDDGGVTTRNLEQFYEAQRRGFADGDMSETLHNVRLDRAGRLAHAYADFEFTSRGATRRGKLMLLMIEEKGALKIAALAFTYH
jgi:hypothetical protein